LAAKKQLKKNFISKEDMYRKIMPSITAPPEMTPEDEAIQGASELPEYEPYNVMELIVRTKLTQAMETLGACTCERCVNDCVALALNSLPPVYTVADADRIREKSRLIRGKNELKITAATIRAVQTVMSEPRH
jgi:competence protein ComFB